MLLLFRITNPIFPVAMLAGGPKSFSPKTTFLGYTLPHAAIFHLVFNFHLIYVSEVAPAANVAFRSEATAQGSGGGVIRGKTEATGKEVTSLEHQTEESYKFQNPTFFQCWLQFRPRQPGTRLFAC